MGSERVPWTVSQSRPPQPLPVRETPRTTTNLTGATSDEELQATLKSAGDRPVCLSRPPSRAVARTFSHAERAVCTLCTTAQGQGGRAGRPHTCSMGVRNASVVSGWERVSDAYVYSQKGNRMRRSTMYDSHSKKPFNANSGCTLSSPSSFIRNTLLRSHVHSCAAQCPNRGFSKGWTCSLTLARWPLSELRA
jgi:hypothetical protein